MVREELVVGLNNAVARGESLEKAMKSLISAGYSSEDVKEASGYVGMGALGKVSIPEISAPSIPEAQLIPSEKPSEAPEMQKKPKTSKKTKWIIVLIVILGLIVIGIAALMIFGESILSALFPNAA